MADKNIKYGNFMQIYVNGTYMGDNAFIALQEVYKFMNNLFPFRILYFKTSSDVINKLDLFNNPTCEIQIHHYRVENTEDTQDSGYSQVNKPEKILYRTDTYLGEIDQQIYPLTEKEQSSLNSNSSDSTNRDVARRVFLYKEDLNLFTNNAVNTVAANVNISDLIAYSFDNCVSDGHSLHIPKTDNENVYDQIIVRPSGFLQLLKSLDEDYGIYLTYYNVFVIDKTVYLINSNKDFTPDDSVEPIKIRLAKATNTVSNIIRGINEEDNSMVLNIESLIVDDTLSEYNTAYESNLMSSGKIVHPTSLTSNNLQIKIGEKILYKPKLQKNTGSNPLRRYAFQTKDVLFDITPLQTWDIVDENFSRNKLRIWSVSRVITPDEISLNMELFDRMD